MTYVSIETACRMNLIGRIDSNPYVYIKGYRGISKIVSGGKGSMITLLPPRVFLPNTLWDNMLQAPRAFDVSFVLELGC